MRSMVVAFVVSSLAACGSIAADDDASTEGDATTDSSLPCTFCVDASTNDVVSPPPVPCPASPPSVGSACALLPSEDCEYGSNSYFCNEHFVCSSGTWAKNTSLSAFCTDASDDCATSVNGGACHAQGQICPSGDASICVCGMCSAGPPPPPQGDASYDSNRWRCFVENAGCSQEPASSGTACDLPDGSTCSFSGGDCCVGFIEMCRSGVWLSYPTVPCP